MTAISEPFFHNINERAHILQAFTNAALPATVQEDTGQTEFATGQQ